MTTILHASIPGASPFDQKPIHSSSYSDFRTLDSLYQSREESDMSYTPNEFDRPYASSAPSSVPSSPQYTQSMFSGQDSCSSTPTSSISLDYGDQGEIEEDGDDDISFPSYNQSCFYTPAQQAKPTSPDTQESHQSLTPLIGDVPGLPSAVQDDHAVEAEPTRHVDYLSHEWREQDIWSSWRYIVARRKTINNSVRLENASWRTWMKAKNNLRTVSPESLNWLKDCDVTWLYGPLQVDTKKSLGEAHSPPPSQLSTSSSFLCKKPILKKKPASAAILERSRSQHSLLQRASEIIRVQQASPAHGRPMLRRAGTDFTLPSFSGSSAANTPAEHETPSTSGTCTFSFPESVTPLECKHVLFDEEVRQVQAIDSEDDKDEQTYETFSESDEDDDGGLMMIARSSTRSTPRGSFSSENKTIVPLPSTTLKYRTDTPEPQSTASRNISFWGSKQKLSPSPSQETLRPARPSHNFLIDDDAEITDEPWHSPSPGYFSYEDDEEPRQGMRRTASGMFMPYDENEEEAAMNSTLFGQAVYAINTFKDIAHVVWNVGWNRK